MILNIKKNQDYIFDFTSLSNEDVKKYIESIIDGVFFVEDSSNSENKLENKKLKELAIDCIQSHKYVRNGKSSVSLRDLQRFKMSYKFFNDYYKNELDEKIIDNNKIEYHSQ